MDMKFRYSFLLLLQLLMGLVLFAQNTGLSIGRYDSLYSTVLKEQRRLLVYVPEEAQRSGAHYPVLFLFDAESQFTKTIGVLDHLSNTTGNEKCPQMIVVGILHNNRMRDLIPPASGKDTVSDKFPAFLEQELIPYINQKYPTQPYRVLAGHSLGGLRVVHTLVYQPHLFNAYLAMDPSLGHTPGWINNGLNTFKQTQYADKSLYIAMGRTMPAGMDTAAIARDTGGASRHMRCIMQFGAQAADRASTNPVFQWKYYPEESHQSVVFYGMYDALVFTFKWFVNERLYDLFKPEVSASEAVQIIADYYQRISVRFGYENKPTEEGTHMLIEYLTWKRWHDKAYAFARYNVQLYPNSARAKQQLEEVKWNTLKPVGEVLQNQGMKAFYRICRKAAAMPEPAYNVSENALNTLGYELMQQQRLKEAEGVFLLNTELYPQSANVYDSYGECLLALKKEKEALEAYRKVLTIEPDNQSAKRMVEQLRAPH